MQEQLKLIYMTYTHDKHNLFRYICDSVYTLTAKIVRPLFLDCLLLI